MSPYCGSDYDFDYEKHIQGMIDVFCSVTWVIEYEVINNPDRKRWQFWKPKNIVREIGV